MLRYEDRMMAHGRLLTIIFRVGRRKPLLYKIPRVFQHHGQSLTAKVFELFAAQMKAATKGRLRKRCEDFIQFICHFNLSALWADAESFKRARTGQGR
jgi:hypothetical protein